MPIDMPREAQLRSTGIPRKLGVVTLVMVTLAALYLRWGHAPAWNFVDLTDFYYGGVSVLDGVDLYAPRRGVLAFNYPPFAGVAFVPLALLGLSGAKVAFTAATVTTYAVSLVAVKRAARAPRRTVVLAGIVGLSLEPVVRTLVLGQIAIILMGLVLADLYLVPPRYRGILVGLAAGVKLIPAVFVLYFVLRREWPSVLRTAATGLGTIAIGWLAAPVASRRYWLGGLDKLDRFGDLAFTPVNQSLTSLVARASGHRSGPLFWLVVVLVSTLMVATAIVVARRGDWTVLTLVLAGATLILSPISWTHHWVWVVPTLAVLLHARRTVTALAFAVAFFIAPMWLVPDNGALSFSELTFAYGYLVLCLALVVSTLAPPLGRQPRPLVVQ